MAKYVRTKLEFRGETEQLKPIIEKLKTDDSAISFTNIIPLEDPAQAEELWGVVSDAEETDVVLWRNGTILEFTFDTPRKPPVPVYKKLAELYPQLPLKVQYAFEEYGENCGIYQSQPGSDELEFVEPDEPFVFACEVWDVDPDEEMGEMAINYYEE